MLKLKRASTLLGMAAFAASILVTPISMQGGAKILSFASLEVFSLEDAI